MTTYDDWKTRDDLMNDDPNEEPEDDDWARQEFEMPLARTVIYEMLGAIDRYARLHGYKIEAEVFKMEVKHLPPEIDNETPF